MSQFQQWKLLLISWGGFGNLFFALAKETLCGEVRSNEAYPRIEDQVQYSSLAPLFFSSEPKIFFSGKLEQIFPDTKTYLKD